MIANDWKLENLSSGRKVLNTYFLDSQKEKSKGVKQLILSTYTIELSGLTFYPSLANSTSLASIDLYYVYFNIYFCNNNKTYQYGLN